MDGGVAKSWPALKSCDNKVKRLKLSSKEEVDDRLSALPDEILFSIMSSFSMKEVARLSIISRRWKYLWETFPRLHFEDPTAKARMFENSCLIPFLKSNFVRWVSGVLDRHLGEAIDELTITFGLSRSCQSDVDKWVAFASEKHVKRLNLNFAIMCSYSKADYVRCTLPLKFDSIKSCLLSLCLDNIDVTNEFVDSLVCSCVFLENLSIRNPRVLTELRISHPLQKQLKHLEVLLCYELKSIDICCPNLVSFEHGGSAVELCIRHASLLSKLSVGGRDYRSSIAYASHLLSQYSSQLEYLCLTSSLIRELKIPIDNIPALPNLNHLVLSVMVTSITTLLGWTPLLEASPVLQKLTLEVRGRDVKNTRRIVRQNKACPLKCLKTLEISGFMGREIDLELARFVLENAIALEEVIVVFTVYSYNGARERLVELETMLPRDVKLIIK